MNEELKKKLQEIIDHDFELAKKNVEESKKEHRPSKSLEDSFCFFVCWDLQNTFGLDLKGVVPE